MSGLLAQQRRKPNSSSSSGAAKKCHYNCRKRNLVNNDCWYQDRELISYEELMLSLSLAHISILAVNFYTLKIDKTGLTKKTRNDGIYAPLVLVIISAILCYGLADTIYV